MALAVVVASCSAGDRSGSDSGAPQGRLVIVGGALDRENADVYRAVLEAREGDGPFCVLPTASGVPEESMASAVAAFSGHGADSVDGVFVTTDNPEAARDPDVAARLGRCSGFWFVGGVQSRVVEVFRPGGEETAAYRAVMTRFEEGAVVSGSSAGAAIMSTEMIAGGSSSGALANGVVVAPAEDDGSDGVLLEDGMGFHPGAVYDQHFLARGRIGRLLVATLAGVEGGVGFGIDENTALVVDGHAARIVGASGVVLVDAREASPSSAGHGGRGVRLHLVGAGDRVDLRTLDVTPAGGKASIPSSGGAVTLPDDPFARWAFLHLLHDFAAADTREMDVSWDGYRLTLEKDDGFRALAYEEEGVQGTPHGLSVGPLRVSLEP